MATWSQWLLLTYLCSSAAWLDERPVLESRDGNLFISAARDRNITLKILGTGYVNVNEINLLHVASAAQNATHLIERLRTGHLANLESDLLRLSHIVEGPDGLERRIATFKGLVEMNGTLAGNALQNQTSVGVSLKVRALTNRVRRLEDKVRSIETKLKMNECTSNPCQNGGTCQDLYEGYQCNCPPNWEGPNCMTDVNECVRLVGTDLGCQNGATCYNYPGSYRCVCSSGWHGVHCTTKLSACSTQTSGDLCGHGVCVSKSNSLGYTCICDQGWKADELDVLNPACVKDVDECAGNHRPCSVNPWVACRNAPGTFFCDACPRGYTGNGYYCTDIDECLVDNGGCSTAPRVECINTMGSRMCGPCPSGYNGDGITCVYVGGCKFNPCHPLATCIENAALTSAYVLCRCPAGFRGDGFGPNGCQPAATVESTHNACSSNPCTHGNCVAGDKGNYICACDTGYFGKNCSTRDPCDPNPCKNSGSCLNRDGAAVCNCPSTYSGPKCETPRQTCGGVTRNLVGELVFPKDGAVYQHDLSCAWLLTTNSLLVLNVTFTKFNIEHSTDCKYDFLQIHDGRNAGSQMIGRFCGNALPNGTGNIISSHNSLYFWFHSDNSISQDGFAFHWESIEPICGGALTADYGTISSPGSPGRYPPNRDCYWYITVQPSKRIQLHFGQLMIEEHPTCENDYLEITSESRDRVGLYCNHTRPPPLIVPGSEAVLHFHSDSAGQDSGFQIHYSTIEGIPGCNGVYTHHSGTISLPAFDNINEDIQCEWKIQMPVGERIRITWSKLDLEYSEECKFDYVEIYDGPTNESPILGRFCGSNLPPTLTSNSNVLLVVFKSFYIFHKKEFTLSYTVLCGGVFTESNGTLHSPMYPNSYHSSRVCTYEIVQPPGKTIMLTILDMEIEGMNPGDCYFDYLEIFDGDNENSTKLATLCGDESDKPPDPYYSTHNYMLLKFVSDSSVEDRGFNANYTTIDSECGGLYKNLAGLINSPLRKNDYDVPDCVWTIQAPPGHVVQLSFLSFQIERSYDCSSYVKVYENYLRTDMDLLGTFCGSKIPPILSSQSNTMSIVWHVINGLPVTDNKFTAWYVIMDASKVCGGHYMKSNGVIKSPNHPKHYPSARECVWIIEAANRHKVVLNVQSFELESHRSCIYDYLEIRNGGYETSPLIGKFCGTQIPSQIISQTNLLYLRFVSDTSRQFNGFTIEWDSTTSGCGGNMNAATGDIISPNYPQPYTHSDCTWKISVASGNLVRLLIVDLDLEHHAKCNFDFIEIYEDIDPNNKKRFCSNPYPKVISGKSNTMNVRFHADYSNFGHGFHLKYETLCQNKVDGFYGVIESPNFPERSEDFLNCTWVIKAPLGNKINLTFSHFELDGIPEQEPSCQTYLDISEGTDNAPNTQLAKICSTDTVPRRTISSAQHQVFVHYMASSPTPVSFRLEWLLDGCGGHLTRPFDSFTSPGYPNSYPANVECEWLIEVDYMTSVELTIHDINTEKQRGCYFDKLQVYSGRNKDAPKLIEICYSDKPLVYTSFGNKMFVKFYSDMSYAARGFNASYRSVPIQCGGRFTVDTGSIYSTNYPSNYPHKQNCEWLLQVAPNFRVNLTFADFDLEKSSNCTDDYVKIYDGPTRYSPLLATLCQNELPGPFVSTGNEMLVVMKTDSIISAKGFKAMYHTACGARLKVKDVGYLTPIWTHLDNMDAENCTWTLIAENPEDHITVSFTHMELGVDVHYRNAGDDCSMLYVEVHEGPSMDGPSLGKWCNNVVPLPVTSSGNALTVHLYSLYNLNAHFASTYSVLNSACGGNYTSFSGKIASPLYPNSYPLNSECVWFLQNSPGNMLKLTFSEFDLQQSDNCDLDYLEVRENNGIGKLLGVYCGNTAEPIESSASIWMKFKSDGDGASKGFVADYTFEGGNELTGPTGRITSPMYPMPTKTRGLTTWRITVEFQQLIRIEIKNLFIENFGSSCFSHLKIYDGYNNEAPVLLETCSLDNPESLTTSSNVAYIEFLIEMIRTGSWFDLTWINVPTDEGGVDTDTQLANCTKLINVGNNEALDLHSPGWPNGYDNNLQCTWVFTCTPGWHIVLRLVILDLEETEGCTADSLSVYDGDALNAPDNAKLLERMCYSNSSYTHLRATDNVMTIKFESDFYINKTGFNAFVRRDCGGKLYGPNGEITLDPADASKGVRSWHILCEWTVQVKPGRTIEVKVTEISTATDLNCAENYLLLKNGDESTSYLLGDGNYCANVKPPTLITTGNRLYVKYVGVGPKVHLKLLYREISRNCGGEYVLKGKDLTTMNITTPNYPNIPPPYSECTWSIMVPSRERITIHFIDRFDLSNSPNCEREYVEVRDGGTESSKLLGRYCKDVAPSSMSTTGNMVYIHFYTDLPEPKNGFHALITAGEVCGGIIRGSSGVISSPNYPAPYKRNENCTWVIIAPVDHTIRLQIRDLDLPVSFYCGNTDHLVISERNPENETSINEIITLCGDQKSETVESSTNRVLVEFKSDNFEYYPYRGFSLNFSSSAGICGGSLTALSGTIRPNGYPSIATRPVYCDWKIKLPLGFQVVVEIDDLDVLSVSGSAFPLRARVPMGFLSFYNDFKFRSKIKSEVENNTQSEIRSSSNTMTIGYFSTPGYRGFKAHYYASVPAPCGGVVKNIKGNLTAPSERPFNESSYYCEWSVEAPDTMANNMTDSGITLSIWATGRIGGIQGMSNWKFCFNSQYISLVDYGQICGNLTEPKYLRSPNPVNEVVIVNGTHGKPMNFVLQYQWQPCGGILEGPTHIIETPQNISFPISCVWNVNYPDTGELIKLGFLKMNMGPCDTTYLSIRNGGPMAPLIGTYCGNIKPDNITSSGNRLWIEYFAKTKPNEFKLILESANNGCGGAVRGKNKQIASPEFPNQYPNNVECSWEITAENGHHVGLVFTNRFNLEGGQGCTNDYVEMFDWIENSNGSSTWKSLGRVCGRNTPPSFNSTSKRMKVIFHSNDKIQGDGFMALWYENCGGVFEVTKKTQVIVSPSYPNVYKPNLFCNYTLVAPGHDIVVKFTEFQLERSRRDCRFDNVTILSESVNYYDDEEIYCGQKKPLPVMSRNKVEILFKTDSYIQRLGFVFQYFIKTCGGEMTAPGVIEPLMRGEKYFGGVTCSWTITAPPDKTIVLAFEKFILEYSQSCFYDAIDFYDSPEMNPEKKLARLCGNLTAHLPTVRSTNNSMVVNFNSDTNREYEGFKAKVLFVKSVAAGCGGFLQLTSDQKLPFKTQKGSTYDSLEDCNWLVGAPTGKNIKFTIDSMDVRNATNKTSSTEACTGDFIEIRDGSNPFAEPIGKYCGTRMRSPLFSSSDNMWIRFVSDSNVEGTGVSGTLEAVDASCGIPTRTVNETRLILTSPNYHNGYTAGVKCRWLLQTASTDTEKIEIQFLDIDLAESTRCETDYVEITDKQNRKYIEEGFGQNFIWSGHENDPYTEFHAPTSSIRYCGKELPHEYYSFTNEVLITFKADTPGHRGFKLNFSNATCSRNYTSEQGRIVHVGTNECWNTITAPANRTIALYFNRIIFYNPKECTNTAIEIYEGGFNDSLLARLCGVETPPPIFSVGNKLSIHSWSEWQSMYEYYDITFTTTDAGRGCGGRIYNYAGTFTSPLYPNEYRNNTVCTWDVSVPRGLKVLLKFTVFDVGSNAGCEIKANTLKLYEPAPDGERTLANTYCGGDNPAPFYANGERILVEYTSTMNNVGTGWVILFKGVQEGETAKDITFD